MTKPFLLLAALAACSTESPDPTPDAAADQPWHCQVRATCSGSASDLTECVLLPDGETPGGQTSLRCPDGCSCAVVACSEGCADPPPDAPAATPQRWECTIATVSGVRNVTVCTPSLDDRPEASACGTDPTCQVLKCVETSGACSS